MSSTERTVGVSSTGTTHLAIHDGTGLWPSCGGRFNTTHKTRYLRPAATDAAVTCKRCSKNLIQQQAHAEKMETAERMVENMRKSTERDESGVVVSITHELAPVDAPEGTCPECGSALHRERIYNASHPGFGSDFLVCDMHGSADGSWIAPELLTPEELNGPQLSGPKRERPELSVRPGRVACDAPETHRGYPCAHSVDELAERPAPVQRPAPVKRSAERVERPTGTVRRIKLDRLARLDTARLIEQHELAVSANNQTRTDRIAELLAARALTGDELAATFRYAMSS